jgi:amino acid adenylation domain-containing protein
MKAVTPRSRPEGFREFPRCALERSIAARFESGASHHEARLAIETSSGGLTYRQLNEAANRLAHVVLLTCSNNREPVVVLTGCDEGLVVATLALLKAGQICVPLSPQKPSRLALLLEQSGARLIVTDDVQLSLAEDISGRHEILNIDRVAVDGPVENPGVKSPPDTPAYILYTSGSTGPAKGVVHSHKSILHIVLDNTNSQHITPEDRIALLSPNGFIGSAATIFRALLNGASLFPFDLQHETPARLARWLTDEEITLAQTVPSVFRGLCSTLHRQAAFPRLRILHLAGEPATKHDVGLFKRWFAPSAVLLNELGATETGALRRMFIDPTGHGAKAKPTDHSADEDAADPVTNDAIPAGYPVEDKEIVVLGPHGETVGQGEIGEIAVKSRYLATAYWRQPTLAEEAFSDVDELGTRLYPTGDLGRLQPDGCLELLGRKDSVVKIRGQQVDLAAVEAALQSRDDVDDAAVVGQSDSTGNMVLVAYVVFRVASAASSTALRRDLQTALPQPLIPSRFVPLAALPLTPTGKVDRQALPFAGRRQTPGVAFAAPRSPTERAIAQIWSEMLGTDRIGLDDNFFDLGGHSLIGALIVARVCERFRIDLPTRSLFDAPTLGAFADRVANAPPFLNDPRPEVSHPPPDGEGQDLSYSQQRLWFLEQWHGEGFAAHIPVVIRLSGDLHRGALDRALDAAISRHDILRCSFTRSDGRPRQIVAPAHSAKVR